MLNKQKLYKELNAAYKVSYLTSYNKSGKITEPHAADDSKGRATELLPSFILELGSIESLLFLAASELVCTTNEET